jgi:hypothetical protein
VHVAKRLALLGNPRATAACTADMFFKVCE